MEAKLYKTAFKRFKPLEINGINLGFSESKHGAAFGEKLRRQVISMKAMDHLKMPELVSNRYYVSMDAEEAAYESLKSDLALSYVNGEITAANAATLTGKLVQMANGAVYADNGEEVLIHNKKLDALEDMIEAANGRSVMVAYWYKHDLARIENRLKEMKIHYEKLDSDASIKKWNNGELPVALIHPASAGHGLNLQSGGNILIWFGLT